MPEAESKLVIIIAAWVIGTTWLARQELRKGLIIYGLGCMAGAIAQFGLGPEMNLYTPNITLYVSYVSVAVILAWGTGLACMWAAHLVFSRLFRIRPNLRLFLFSAIPVMTILEFIGSNVIRMKLHDYHTYSPLMPALNSMHAPVWLFGYYGLVAVVFYVLLARLGMNTGEWPAWVWPLPEHRE